MTQKTWTASDIRMAAIKMHLLENGKLSAIQDYIFLDDQGERVKDLPNGRVSISLPFDDLPVNIKTALTEINTYMYNQALTQEGMD